MSMAFGISVDDVITVAARAGLALGDPQAQDLLVRLDDGAIEHAALYFTDMDEQTQAAHDEIHRQLGDMGVLAAKAPAAPRR